MAEYTWIIPDVPASSGGVSSTGGATGGGTLANYSLELVIDPITRDLIDADDGWFVESGDSRTTVLWQLESHYLAWWGDPFSGSRTAAILSGDDPGDMTDLRDEVLRALQQLVDAQIISELAATIDKDETGRNVLLLNYRDRASGSAVDLAYVPFGG